MSCSANGTERLAWQLAQKFLVRQLNAKKMLGVTLGARKGTKERGPDRWQPDWIVKKCIGGAAKPKSAPRPANHASGSGRVE